MANGAYLRQVRRIFDGATVAGLSEGQLLERFVSRRDETAFEALVARHGPMVFGVCRRILRDPSDAEDAFQATFLVLVRQARSIRGRDTLGGWLHRVAYRVAVRASVDRRKPEHVDLDAIAAPESNDRDLIALIHEELERLPSKYRAPIILCDLENHTHEEAAQALHWPLGTVKGRLSRARNLLKDRLMRRGVGVPAVAVGLALGRDAKAAVSPALLHATVRAAMSVAAGKGLVAGVASTVAVGLAQGVMRTMFWQSIKLSSAVLVAVSLVGVAGIGASGQVPGGDDKGAVSAGEPKQVDPLPASPAIKAEGLPPKQDPDADLRPTARAILGTWKVVRKQDGDVDEIGLPFKDQIVITRDRIQLGKPGEADLTYDLVLLASPKRIRMSPTFGPKKGTNVEGVFRIDDASLKIAYMGLDNTGIVPGSVDGNTLGGSIFVIEFERVAEESNGAPTRVVSSPATELTALQGAWTLREQTYRFGGKEYKVNKLSDSPGMYGGFGGGFSIRGDEVCIYEGVNNEPTVVGRIMRLSNTVPKQIDIVRSDHEILPSLGIPIGNGIYTLDANRFTICYDPVHPFRRPEQFLRETDDVSSDTRVFSVFERQVPPEAAEDLKGKDELRGRWKVISIVGDGAPMHLLPFGNDFVFSDSWQGTIGERGISYVSDYRTSPKSNPKQVDFVYFPGPQRLHRPTLQPGIYRIDGDRLTICRTMWAKEQPQERPSDFLTKPESHTELLTLERVAPLTDEISTALRDKREEFQVQVAEATRKLRAASQDEELPNFPNPLEGQAAPPLPILDPDALDEKQAELQMEQELLSMESSALKEAMFKTTQELREAELRLQTPVQFDGSPLSEKERTKLMLEIKDARDRIESQKKKYVTKFKEQSRLKRELQTLGGGPSGPVLAAPPLTVPSGATNSSDRLAEFDRQIRVLQQKRDAFLMSLPDDERQKLMKQLAR